MLHDRRNVWVMHSGTDEIAHEGFVKTGYVSLGWKRMADLSKLPKDRKEFLRKFKKKHPGERPAASRIKSGELYRFCHEMQLQDTVIYYSSTDGHVYVGRIAGDYEFKPAHHRSHQHARSVVWLKSLKASTVPKVRRAILRFRLSISKPRKNLKSILSLLK